jgi:hypothetical protein
MPSTVITGDTELSRVRTSDPGVVPRRSRSSVPLYLKCTMIAVDLVLSVATTAI